MEPDLLWKSYLKRLRLPAMAAAYPKVGQEAAQANARYEQYLLTLLERVVRTSCAAEAINSVLRPFLESRRECTDQTSRQLFLNLFTLWFNLHKFDRGPRAGKSPYQLAGIDLGSDDWLTVLGYLPG